jgi:hypothetical protein
MERYPSFDPRGIFCSSRVATDPPSADAIPKVISFTASSGVADQVTNRGQITFSWSTQNADYIKLSYRCTEGTANGIAILGTRQDDPISILVTITPFSRGTAYGDLSKSLTVAVGPWNPFPKGAPAESRNITLSYSLGPEKIYRRGSAMTIQWTYSESRDACINLYLVRDNGSGVATYRARVAEKWLPPAGSGSYTWRLPNKYRGSGFRIYAAAPGNVSSALGERFEIRNSVSR